MKTFVKKIQNFRLYCHIMRGLCLNYNEQLGENTIKF